MAVPKPGCVAPAAGVLGQGDAVADKLSAAAPEPKGGRMVARVGKPAPDFEANAYHQGAFKTIKLSDFRGRWIVLCFYPGDFTFV